MKKSFLLLAVVALCTAMSVSGKKKTVKIDNVAEAKIAIQRYQFERADSLLKAEISTLKKRRRKTADLEELLSSFQQERILIHATEQVVFIDSIVCPFDSMMQYIPISKDAGRLDTWARTYYTHDSLHCMLYENELANKRFFAKPVGEGQTHLFSTDKVGEKWTEPAAVKGLNEDTQQNYPYLLSDGITLYYAADGEESLGGFDIFITRCNGDDGSCLTPENLGYPFNSPENDFLYIVDEMNNLGWFVTDRRQPEGYVCVYTFIPNEVRKVYGDEVSAERLGNLAQLTSIKDTWTDETLVAAACERLEQLQNGNSSTQLTKNDFYFPINATTNYTSYTHFRSAEAKEKMKTWVTLQKTLQTDRQLLSQLRDRYATANETTRLQLTQTIQRLEATYYPQLQELKRLSKEIRLLENVQL